MSKWATWVADYTATNGAGAGEVTFDAVPGKGNEMELQSAMFVNHAIGAELVRAGVYWEFQGVAGDVFSDLTEFLMIDGSLQASSVEHWPQNFESATSNRPTGYHPINVAGDMSVWLQFNSLAGGRVVRFVVVGRIRGRKPTVTVSFAGGSGGTSVANKDQVF